jgi:hypothetical protein
MLKVRNYFLHIELCGIFHIVLLEINLQDLAQAKHSERTKATVRE